MTIDHAHHNATPTPFTEAEINTFHSDDRKQAGIVVVLIAAIFLTGVLIYTIVATGVAMNPHQ